MEWLRQKLDLPDWAIAMICFSDAAFVDAFLL